MPRTSAVECPGCPPLRALTTDVLGLVKVVEARGKAGTPKVVETWGLPDASHGALVASYADRKTNPLLAVARKNGCVEFLNPLNGEALTTIKFDETNSPNDNLQEDHLVGLHLFSTKGFELNKRLGLLLTCSEKGKACLRSIPMKDTLQDSHDDSTSKWSVCNAGKVICSKVDGSENHALFGGKGIEVNLWDLQNNNKIWTAKSPPSNNLGVFSPTWFTAATFLSKEDHRKIVAGTNNHQVRLYDTLAQRRPVLSVDFRESPIKAVTEDLDGYTIYVGTGSGDLAAFDMRTGKLLGSYIGKCSGSIRSIARHPELPVIASCGLDRYLRFWDTTTRQLLSAVFLKQHLTNVVIDSYFSGEGPEGSNIHHLNENQICNDIGIEDTNHPEEKKPSKSKEQKKNSKKKSKSKGEVYETSEELADDLSEPEDDDELPLPKQKKRQSEDQRTWLKTKKSKNKGEVHETREEPIDDLSEPEEGDELLPPKQKKKTSEQRIRLKPKKSKKSLS